MKQRGHGDCRAVFLDRDGTLIRDMHYLGDPDLVELLPGVSDGLRKLKRAGWRLIVVSNQSGVARGIISASDIEDVNGRMLGLLAEEGATVDDVFVCMHGPTDECDCRKPLPGLLLLAAKADLIDLSKSWMLGDRMSDIGAGLAAGTRAILLTGEESEPDASERHSGEVAYSFSDAVSKILGAG